MKFTEGWLRSKTLWLVSVPGVATAAGAWLSGEMKWWQALGAILLAVFASTIRDTVASNFAAMAERDEERLALVKQSERRAQAFMQQQKERHTLSLEIPPHVHEAMKAEQEQALEATRRQVEDEARAAYDGYVLGDTSTLDEGAGEGDDEDDGAVKTEPAPEDTNGGQSPVE